MLEGASSDKDGDKDKKPKHVELEFNMGAIKAIEKHAVGHDWRTAVRKRSMMQADVQGRPC